jgi:hypothetical protein
MSRRLSTDMSPHAQRGIALLLIVGMVLSVVLAAGVSFYASSSPDGLESVAAGQGFSGSAQDSALAGSPFADYGVSGVDQQRWSVALAGLIGVAVTTAVAFLLFRLLIASRGTGPAGDGARPAGASTDPADLG